MKSHHWVQFFPNVLTLLVKYCGNTQTFVCKFFSHSQIQYPDPCRNQHFCAPPHETSLVTREKEKIGKVWGKLGNAGDENLGENRLRRGGSIDLNAVQFEEGGRWEGISVESCGNQQCEGSHPAGIVVFVLIKLDFVKSSAAICKKIKYMVSFVYLEWQGGAGEDFLTIPCQVEATSCL